MLTDNVRRVEPPDHAGLDPGPCLGNDVALFQSRCIPLPRRNDDLFFVRIEQCTPPRERAVRDDIVLCERHKREVVARFHARSIVP